MTIVNKLLNIDSYYLASMVIFSNVLKSCFKTTFHHGSLRSCQLASSSACEGNLSTYDYDYIFSKRRNTLSTETVEELVYTRDSPLH